MNLRQEDTCLYLQQLSRRWLDQELISAEGAAAIVEAYPTRLRTKSMAIRAVQFFGVLVASAALVGLFGVLLDDFGQAFLLVSFAAAVLAFVLMERGHFCAGIDEGGWGAALLFTGLGASIVVEAESPRLFFTVTALVALVPASFGYLLSAVILWAAISALFLDTYTSLGLMMVLQLALALILHWIEPGITWRRRLRQVAALRLASALGAFFAANRFLPELFVGADVDWGRLQPVSREFALLAVPALALLYLLIGLRTRRRALVDVGLIALVVAALSLGHELSGAAMESVMIVVGLGLISVTLVLRSWLRGNPAGFTADTWSPAIPPGWSREDLQSSEVWAKEILSGLNKDVRAAHPPKESNGPTTPAR